MAKFLSNISLEQANDIQFKTAAGANAGKIEQDGNDLVLTNAVGDVLLGDGDADVYIGDGTNNVDILFEQSGNIKADDSASSVTLTIGSSNTTLNLISPNVNGSISLGVTNISSKLTFTTTSGYILFDHEPSGDVGAYDGTTSVPMIKVDRAGGELTILERVSQNGAILLGNDDSVIIAAGDTRATMRNNINEGSEEVVFAAEGGFTAYGFPDNMSGGWSARQQFRFYTGGTTIANNGLYIGSGGDTQFIDLSRNLKNIGTIGSGAITSTGKITGTELEGTSLDINGTADVSGILKLDSELQFLRGSGEYSNYIRSSNWPSISGYSGSTAKYWLEYGSKGGHHFVVNTDGGAGSSENVTDYFTIWNGAVDGDNVFNVSNVGNTTIAGAVSLTGGALSISGDGSNAATLTESSAGDFDISTVDDLRLTSGGNDVVLRGASSAEFGRLTNSSQDFVIRNTTSDKDIIFKGNDGGATITALTLDMSDSGKAYFNHEVVIGSLLKIPSLVYHVDDLNTFFGFNSTDQWNVTAGGNVGIQLQNTGVYLYFGGSEKLKTVTGGVEITGEVQGDTLNIDGNADISGTLNVHQGVEIADVIDGEFTALRLMNQKTYGSGTGTNEKVRFVMGISESGIAYSGREGFAIDLGISDESDSSNGIVLFKVRDGGTLGTYQTVNGSDKSVAFAGTGEFEGNVIINTPSANNGGQGLTINRPAAGTHYASVEFATNGTVDWSVGTNSTDAFEIYENGSASTTRFSIAEGGNATFAGTISSGALTITQAPGGIARNIINSGESAFRFTTSVEDTSTNTPVFRHGIYHNTTENATIAFYRGSSSVGGFMTFQTQNGNERMRIAADGKVGIGVAAASRLHAYDNSSGTDYSTGITVEQDGTGDALVTYLLTGTRRWVTGIDNSDSDKFKIASSDDLGTDTRFSLDVSGNASFSGSVTSGGQITGTELEGTSLDINGNADISGALTLGTALAVAEGGTGLTANTTYINSNSFANFAATQADHDTITARGLYRFQGGANGAFGTSHSTGLTLTENSGNYGWQMVANSSADNGEGIAYRYKGTSWGPWQKLVTKTFGDGRYATTAQGTLATNALPKTGGTMSGAIAMGNQNITGAGTITGTTLTGTSLLLGTTNVTSQRLQVNGYIDITAVSTSALRWYNGSTFRGGLGLDDWAHSGSSSDITMYIAGDNSFHVSTNNVKRAEFNATGLNVVGELEADSLDIDGNADISGNLAVDGIANLDNTDIDGTFNATGTTFDVNSSTSLTLDNTNTTNGVKINTATSGSPVTIGHATSEVLIADNLTINGNLTTKGDVIIENTTNLAIRDTIITLNDGTSGTSGTDSSDIGIMMERHGTNKFFGYDASENEFIMVESSEDVSGAVAGVQMGTTQTLAANIRAYDSIKIGETANDAVSVFPASTTTSLGTSNTLVPTQNAVKSYVDAKTWNGNDITAGTVVSARLDADTAHLSETQTFSGAKTFSAATSIGSAIASNKYSVVTVQGRESHMFAFTGLADHTLTLNSSSYFQAEVIITAHQTNSGTYNNLYIRGIWSNNYHSHHWDEIENIGGLTNSTFTITNGQNGSTAASGQLAIVHDYVSASFSNMTVNVIKHFGTLTHVIS